MIQVVAAAAHTRLLTKDFPLGRGATKTDVVFGDASAGPRRSAGVGARIRTYAEIKHASTRITNHPRRSRCVDTTHFIFTYTDENAGHKRGVAVF